jgi:stage V sporulation protein B
MYVLYYGRFATQGAGLMAWMGIAAFFLCFFQATNCVLQAYGFQRYTLYTLPVGGVVKIILNWFLLADPRVNIYGAAISTVACYVVISVMNVILVKRNIPDPPSFRKILLRPMLCTAVMALTAWASYGLISHLVFGPLSNMPSRLPIAIALFGSIGVAMVVYLVLIIALRALTLEDMQMLPKGEKLAKILRIR